MEKIYLSPPSVDDFDLQNIIAAFNSGWIAPLGPYVDLFEKDLCEYTKASYSLALSSGSAGLHLALRVLDVGPDDIVICPDFTFIASVSPVLMTGAKPVFVDCDSSNYGLCPKNLAEILGKLSQKPKAIIVAHLYGKAANIFEIIKIAKQYNILVIEDAAESLGTFVGDKHTGTIGDIGVLSFNGNKIITTSGGGALISNNKSYVEKARHLSQQAKDPDMHYFHTTYGYNYRLSNLLAALGVSQLKKLENRIKIRARINENYRELLKNYPITFTDSVKGVRENNWLTNIYLKDLVNLDEVVNICLSKQVEVRRVWRPMKQQPVFSSIIDMKHKCSENISNQLFSQGLSLPTGDHLTIDQQRRVVEVLIEAIDQCQK